MKQPLFQPGTEHTHHGPFLDHQTSPLHPIITHTVLHTLSTPTVPYRWALSISIERLIALLKGNTVCCSPSFYRKTPADHRPSTLPSTELLSVKERLERWDNVILLLMRSCFAKQELWQGSWYGADTDHKTVINQRTHTHTHTHDRFLFTASF